jgi:dihydrofolate reductase
MERRVSLMSRLIVACFGVSLDGFGAGPDQGLDNPLGVGGGDIMKWAIATKTFRDHGFAESSGTTGIDDDFAARSFRNIGAWIMGRNMFGPVRGPWLNDEWKGWWGDDPVYHCPVFVLTHHPRADLVMEGGTTFHFVTDGIESALARARDAAGGKDVRLGGGAATIRQYLTAGLVDELHLAIAPVLLGRGEPLLSGLDLPKLGYRCAEYAPSARAAHMVIRKREA